MLISRGKTNEDVYDAKFSISKILYFTPNQWKAARLKLVFIGKIESGEFITAVKEYSFPLLPILQLYLKISTIAIVNFLCLV